MSDKFMRLTARCSVVVGCIDGRRKPESVAIALDRCKTEGVGGDRAPILLKNAQPPQLRAAT